MNILLLYIAVISLVTAVVTVYDKIASKKGAWRIPEKTLLLLALVGGAAAEFAVMLMIRHKTRHKKFMIGLPAILVAHVAIITAVIFFL
ncbi:MAG: DUF1294 domain-containing protein [Ruminococcaceae bacterium]|nr:DUF1294 domain-containing protein [Oscillospiraceae bacterium]